MPQLKKIIKKTTEKPKKAGVSDKDDNYGVNKKHSL